MEVFIVYFLGLRQDRLNLLSFCLLTSLPQWIIFLLIVLGELIKGLLECLRKFDGDLLLLKEDEFIV